MLFNLHIFVDIQMMLLNWHMMFLNLHMPLNLHMSLNFHVML